MAEQLRDPSVPPLAVKLEITHADHDTAQEAWMVPGEEDIEIIVLGIPAPESEEETDRRGDSRHNCDEMGCRQCHVITRIKLPRSAWPPRPSEVPS